MAKQHKCILPALLLLSKKNIMDNKSSKQMTVKYCSLSADRKGDYECEDTLDKIFSPGSYIVEIDHTGDSQGLPVPYCDEEHYIVGNLVVTDNGTLGPRQRNRLTGQQLTLTSREGKDTKVYTRTFADGTWSAWHSLAETGAFEDIGTPDELVATVNSLRSDVERLRGEGEGSVAAIAGSIIAPIEEKVENNSRNIDFVFSADYVAPRAVDIESPQGKKDVASFIKRSTAGHTTVMDSFADVDTVGGCVLRNLVDGSFENGWSITNGEFEVNDGVVKVTPLAGVMRLSGAMTQNYVEVSGHLYYTRCNIYCTAATGGLVLFDYSNGAGSTSVSPAVVSGLQWETVSTRYKSSASEFYRGCCIVDKREEKNGVIYACNPLYIDLTDMFGAGNEPTKDECDEMFSAVGTLPKGFTAATPKYLKSIGYNQCDTSKAVVGKTVSGGAITDGANILVSMPCLPCKRGTGENNGYILSNGVGLTWNEENIVAVYYSPFNPLEAKGELYMHKLEPQQCHWHSFSHNIYLPPCSGWLLIEATTADELCARFAWGGDRIFETFEPYKERIVPIPEIPQMGEWGLAGVKGYNDIIDYTKNEYVKAVNRVVLNGTESWGKRPNNMGFWNTSLLADNPAKSNSAMLDADVKLVVQISTNTYGTIAVDNNSIYVNYSETVNAMTVEEFKQYLAAHPITIFYVLATPQVYQIEEVMYGLYHAKDYGIEEFVGTAVPVCGTILFYKRSLVGEMRNFLDRIYAVLDTTDTCAVADRLALAVQHSEQSMAEESSAAQE